MPQITSVNFAVPTVVVADAEFVFTATFNQAINRSSLNTSNFNGHGEFEIIDIIDDSSNTVVDVRAKALPVTTSGNISINLGGTSSSDNIASGNTNINSSNINIKQSPHFTINAETTSNFELSKLFSNPLDDTNDLSVISGGELSMAPQR